MKKKYYAGLGAMALNFALFAGVSAVSAHAADGFVYHEDGTASYYEAGTVLTGKFLAGKGYTLGDISGDDTVSSTDAAGILIAAAAAGADSTDAAEVLAGDSSFLTDADTARRYADTNEDGSINASDAAVILSYAAASGADQEVLPLGSAYYCADESGVLRQGLVTDASGAVFYAGEDYKLRTGWIEAEEAQYYFGSDAAALTGMQTIGGKQYYFSTDGAMQTGWQTIGVSKYYFNADGVMHTGWLDYEGKTYRFAEDGKMMIGWYTIDGNRYHFNASGIMYTGLIRMIDGNYYFSSEGIMQTGLHTIDGVTYLFGEDGKMCTGWVTFDGDTYYYDEKGVPYTGWMETDDGDYYFTAEGRMLTGFADLGSGMVYFEPDGRYYGKCTDITDAKTAILENAALNPHDSYTIWNRQVSPEKEYMKITLKEKDVAILEQFAAEHFTEDMTMAQKLWITQQWIHKKVDYAYAGEKWNSIVNLSYVEAIYVNRMGQCVQYNGAMAAMMIWFGYDVYMVKGWTSTGNQHFWTEVVIDGKTYLMECGNYGKNGNWHDFLEPLD